MVALVGGTPQTLGLKAMLQHFLDFRVGFRGLRGYRGL
jgi:DNA gyrase/topoisomerase IV subunit A